MKGLKLAIAILVFGTTTINPKANAKSLLDKRQSFDSPTTAQISSIQDNKLNNTKAYFERGSNRFEKKDYQGAIEDFSQVLKREPNHVYAYFGRGTANLLVKEYQAAKADLDKVIEIDPNIAYAYYFRGFTKYALQDKQGALADFQKASALFKQEGNQEFAQRADNAIQTLKAS
ncbi:hypothetical protein WA1_08050 [Scytonema hofmannii PCC 7110]|uniref:Uncharacterized protein n=1 Tax=Scytonema hofmannii PCC 7110 TaxID=128403 RepID=A0A139WTG9_9CYAN|nr:tetratricopeptide repeat protein [Scytonema hofmannii]KYC35745.1 hypothetical protein WA1_08050 [Scytonema hofmannii PCC 7110]